jgi:hypothetical protein
MLKHPNYTFFIPDKRLYTLFKGITVTPRFVRASSVSSHGRDSFTRGAFCLSFIWRPLHVRHAYVWRCFSDEAGATTHAVSSAPKRPIAPLQLWEASEMSHMTRPRPASEHSRRVGFLIGPHLRRRSPVTPNRSRASHHLRNSTHTLQVKLVFLLESSLSTPKSLRTDGSKLATQAGRERTLLKAIFPNIESIWINFF